MSVTVTSSQAIISQVQKDGRSYVLEKFGLSDGRALQTVYLAPVGFDTDAHLSAAAVQLIADLKASEIDANVSQVTAVGSLANPTLAFSTAAENFAALRDFYATATQVQAVMAGDFLNTLTNGQIATAFGITTGQAATLRTNKLVPAASIATSIRAAVGQ
jgi:hypothetical protein